MQSFAERVLLLHSPLSLCWTMQDLQNTVVTFTAPLLVGVAHMCLVKAWDFEAVLCRMCNKKNEGLNSADCGSTVPLFSNLEHFVSCWC